jgi:HAD superfamily hydrolase (TIGR01458 family)
MTVEVVGAVLVDLEGTLYANNEPLPGATAAVAAVRASGLPLRFLTNIDSRPPAEVAEQVRSLGLDVRVDELFTPVSAARALFAATPETRVYALVSDSLRGSLGTVADQPPYTHVLVGDCRDVLDYPRLDHAFRALRAGAHLVALQRGRYYKRADGDHLDTGGVVAALEYAADVRAQVLGKPAVDFFELAARSVGVAVTDCLVVGDDATTDVAGGRAAGARTVQVRTGKYADQAAEGLTGQADRTIDSIADLAELLGVSVR